MKNRIAITPAITTIIILLACLMLATGGVLWAASLYGITAQNFDVEMAKMNNLVKEMANGTSSNQTQGGP